MAQARAGGTVLLGHDVAAIDIEHGHMHVHAAARDVAVGFGHKGRIPAMPARNTLDDTLEQKGMVSRGHGVGYVLEVDFVLAGPVFAHDRIGRQVLQFAGGEDIGQHGFKTVQLGNGEHLRLPALPTPLAGHRRRDGGRAACGVYR